VPQLIRKARYTIRNEEKSSLELKQKAGMNSDEC